MKGESSDNVSDYLVKTRTNREIPIHPFLLAPYFDPTCERMVKTNSFYCASAGPLFAFYANN